MDRIGRVLESVDRLMTGPVCDCVDGYTCMDLLYRNCSLGCWLFILSILPVSHSFYVHVYY